MISVEPGDIFLTNRGGFVSNCIIKVTKFWSLDADAKYSHAGIVVGYGGETFESRWIMGRYNLSEFSDVPIVIARHQLMDADKFERGMEQVIRYEGTHYPVWRIPFHIIPPLARKWSTGNYLVCSETVSKFLWGCDLLGEEQYKGWTPDNLDDMIHHWRHWRIIKEVRNY